METREVKPEETSSRFKVGDWVWLRNAKALSSRAAEFLQIYPAKIEKIENLCKLKFPPIFSEEVATSLWVHESYLEPFSYKLQPDQKVRLNPDPATRSHNVFGHLPEDYLAQIQDREGTVRFGHFGWNTEEIYIGYSVNFGIPFTEEIPAPAFPEDWLIPVE